MDVELRQYVGMLFESLKRLQEQTDRLSISVKSLVEAATTGNPEFHDKYQVAFAAQEISSKTEEHALALEQIDAAIQAMLANQTGQA
jgi:methyl-accepting chemotaxis protein